MLFSFTKGETDYSLRLLPIGGFVAMEGEDEESDDERAFSKAKPFKRIIVVAAGAIFNIILGFILMVSTVSISGATQSQNLIATTSIASFEKNATTNKNGGLKEKDKIIEEKNKKLKEEKEKIEILKKQYI